MVVGPKVRSGGVSVMKNLGMKNILHEHYFFMEFAYYQYVCVWVILTVLLHCL